MSALKYMARAAAAAGDFSRKRIEKGGGDGGSVFSPSVSAFSESWVDMNGGGKKIREQCDVNFW